MKYLATAFFKDDSGAWHQPGTVAEFDKEEAAVYRARGLIVAYQTQMVKPPETRVRDITTRRRRGVSA